MNKVPAQGYVQSKFFGTFLEEGVIVRGVPAPSGVHDVPALSRQGIGLEWSDEWNEIRGKPNAVGALVHTRFRDTFFKQVVLPSGIAERLEDFEKGLRLAGLMGADEVLRQQASRPPKFRVQKGHISDYRHDGNSVVDCSERATHSAVESENQQKATTPYRRGRRLSAGRYEA